MTLLLLCNLCLPAQSSYLVIFLNVCKTAKMAIADGQTFSDSIDNKSAGNLNLYKSAQYPLFNVITIYFQVLVTPNATSIEKQTVERRLSQMSTNDEFDIHPPSLSRRNSARSPRPVSFRRPSLTSNTLMVGGLVGPLTNVDFSSSPQVKL
jgi:hypothetical protein